MSRQGTDGYRNLSNGSDLTTNGKPIGMSSQARPQNSAAQSAVSRADRFEDEKRRIIESCFTKQDQNGQLAESYITHIRIQEDSQYPSSPPPPESAPENKKPRLIIIAVRSTGRVRMHKARENNNGSFSIGKTWNMEELSAIESYSPSTPPQDEKDAQLRFWGGSMGFTVTVTKPYYWQAGTAKEKEFFIASAVKIYRKYTKGQVPELRGFDEQQKNMMLGLPPSQGQPPRPAQNGSRVPSGNEMPAPPQPPFAARPQSRDNSRYRESPGPPPSLSDRDFRSPSGSGSRAPSEGHSPGRFNDPASSRPRPFASTEQLRSQGSREGMKLDSRPGTSPGQTLYRSSPPPLNQMPPPPSTPFAPTSQPRTQSPGNTSMQASRERPQSPLRNEAREDQASLAALNGAAGAELLASSRQRLMNHQNLQTVQTSSYQNTEVVMPSPSAYQAPAQDREPQRPPPEFRSRIRKDSEAIDPSDAATFGLLTGFEPPPHAIASSPSPQEISAPTPASPLTPERSKRRPPLDPTRSGSSVDLRPLPLNAKKLTDNVVSRENPVVVEQVAQDQSVSPPRSTPRQLDTSTRSESNGPAVAERPLMETSVAETQLQESMGEEEEFRPGLGPMIRKKAVAERLKKAATAANAFKPRPGGAAEKILKAKAEREASGGPSEPDGITRVVPRPVAKQEPPKDEKGVEKGVIMSSASKAVNPDPPVVEISSPVMRPPSGPVIDISDGMDGASSQGVELHDDALPDRIPTPVQQQRHMDDLEAEQHAMRQQQVKIKRRSAQQLRYLEELGIDTSLLVDKCLGFEAMLYDFGWADAHLSQKALSNMETDIRREQTRLEAGAWLAGPTHEIASSKDDKEAQVLNLLDKAIQECDEMDGLLTIYSVELSSLNDDVAFIEAQSQGLQVQSANQRLLHNELSSLLSIMSLDKRTMEPLRRADLSSPRGLEDVEGSLMKLYNAIVTIDPDIHSAKSGRRKSKNATGNGNDLTNMSALRQKRDVYERESDSFCQRFVQHLDRTFTKYLGETKARALVPANAGTVALRKDAWVETRRNLWMYSALILYAKELNPPAWNAMLNTYQTKARPLYSDVFGQNLASWKRTVKKPTGEEAEILFTAQEKEETPSSTGALSSARKLTVKRSHTLARTLRHAGGNDKHSPTETRHSGSMMPSEIFSNSVDEMAVLVSQEQNFVVDLFHVTSLENADFTDAVSASRPEERAGANLQMSKPADPDRDMAQLVTATMNSIFGFFSPELSSLLDWSIANDPIQGIGVMACLNRHAFFLQDSSQEFLVQLIEQLMARLQNLFTKFVQEQVRAIEETKVKIKKRKGVIAFMKIFPHFSAAVENVFSAVGRADYDNDAACMFETRRAVDDAYNKINRAMFDSLKIIAKESPTAATAPSGAPSVASKMAADDPEDKEILNHHILLIENMNHYIEEVDDGGKEGILAEWKGKALMERAEAMEAYVGRVIRRPLGKLLDFIDSVDSVRESHPHNPAAITARPTYSRKAARNVLAQYDSKEVRRGIDTLRKRIEKHFGDADDEPISRALVTFVCKECERGYDRTVTRCEDMIRELYPATEGEKPVELEFSKADVQAGFRR